MRIAGRDFTWSAADIVQTVRGRSAEPIRTYAVQIRGVDYPPKQVLQAVTGWPRSTFTTHEAQRALRALGFPSRTVSRAAPTSVSHPRAGNGRPPAPVVRDHRAPDIVLISCGKSKEPHRAAAKDLYTSVPFRKARAYAEASGTPWFILSAKYGLLSPDEPVDPYDLALDDTAQDYRRAWAQRVVAGLTTKAGPLPGLTIEVHAGRTYVEPLRAALQRLGADLTLPLAGLRQGERLAWYTARACSAPATTPGAQRCVAALCDAAAARTPDQILATGGAGLGSPGLYGWWVDDAGAGDLAAGLGLRLDAGLVYVGQAGAARSRSGKASTNTLWLRIATMHLGSHHGLSTLRLTLGSVLAQAHGWGRIDEPRLTEWMCRHLRVVTVPVRDAAALGAIEVDVLRRLDPPLNLRHVPSTPLRTRLSILRRTYARRSAATSQ